MVPGWGNFLFHLRRVWAVWQGGTWIRFQATPRRKRRKGIRIYLEASKHTSIWILQKKHSRSTSRLRMFFKTPISNEIVLHLRRLGKRIVPLSSFHLVLPRLHWQKTTRENPSGKKKLSQKNREKSEKKMLLQKKLWRTTNKRKQKTKNREKKKKKKKLHLARKLSPATSRCAAGALPRD